MSSLCSRYSRIIHQHYHINGYLMLYVICLQLSLYNTETESGACLNIYFIHENNHPPRNC